MRSQEVRDKIGASRKGHIVTQETRDKIRKTTLGKKYSEERRKNMSIATLGKRTGTSNHNWKGDNVSYGALHSWISRKLGKPKHCANCETNKAKKYEWANISHAYKRDLSDWIRLCTRCHRLYDLGKITL